MLPPVKIRLHGDRGLASQYVGHCKSRLLRLERRRVESNLPALLERVLLSARISVVLHTTDWGRFIDITASVAGECFIWMDSGLVDLGNGAFSEAHVSAMAPSILYLDGDFGTLPRGKLGTDDDAALGFSSTEPGAVDGGPTYAYAIVPNEDGTTTPDTMLPVKKNFSATTPASMFSGNARMFVQALYGRKFSAIDVARYQTVTVASVPALKLSYGDGQSLTICNTTGRSTGIYIDDTYRPWFTEVFSSAGTWQVRVLEAALTVCGEKVRAILQEQYPDVEASRFINERNALVTWMFSQTWPKANGFNQVFNTGVAATGEALAYGWSFNKRGSQCQIVTHVSATVNGNQECQQARRYVVNLARDTVVDLSQYPADQREQHRWAISGGLTDGPSNWNAHFGVEYIWVPLWGLGMLELTRYYAPGTTQLGVFSEVAIHVYFPPDTDMITEIKVRETSVPAGNDGGRGLSETCWEGCGTQVQLHPDTLDSDTKNSWSSARSTYRLTIGSTEYTVNAAATATRESWVLRGSSRPVPTPPTYVPTGPTNNPGSSISDDPTPFVYTAPCYGVNNSSYETARDAALVSNPCLAAARSASFFMRGGDETVQNTGAEREVDNDSIAESYNIALVLPMYDCTSAYVFKEQREVGSRERRLDGTNYAGYRYYAFAHYTYDGSNCTYSHHSYWHLRKVDWDCSLSAFTIGAPTYSSIDDVTIEADAFFGSAPPVPLPDAVRDSNKENLFNPSIASPFHSNPFMTRTAANMGGVAGEGILQGGYSIPNEAEVARYLLSFIGFA